MAEGVRELRAALHESQQQFSNRLGVSISTVVRYELQRPPQGYILTKLAAIARESGRTDLGELFEKVLEASIDRRKPVAQAIRELRASVGESQQEFAHRVGLAVVSVARYETNARPKKAVLARLATVARDLGRPDLQTVFEQAEAAETVKTESDESVLSGFPQLSTPEGADFLKRISDKRMKRLRKLFSKEFHSERDLSAICAAAWLLEHYSYFKERDAVLVEQIKHVLDRRAIPLTAAEFELLGELGRKALAEQIQKIPMSEAVRSLREHMGVTKEVLAAILQTPTTAIEEFEAGTRAPGKEQLQIMSEIMGQTVHKRPELDIAFSVALEKLEQAQRSGANKGSMVPHGGSKDEGENLN